jgi:two-component system sensor histidine kinase CpxA
MKPVSSLLTKILGWFFLNLLIVAAALAVFFAFQPHINLHAIFGHQGAHRLRTAGQLITHDLNQKQRAYWSDILSRHAAIHKVDFTLMLADGTRFSSSKEALPGPVVAKIKGVLRHRLPNGRFTPAHVQGGRGRRPNDPALGPGEDHPPSEAMGRRSTMTPSLKGGDTKPHLRMRTRQPTRYWSGIRIRLAPATSHPVPPAFLLAASDSISGNGFFFDPLPWMVVAAAVILISVMFWIPMVRHISRPLGRMTRATEQISKGRFDVTVHEPRKDEIGRLAEGINRMAARLSAFVKGQKRFLGDVSHELGSPIARIQFGLGALEQRVNKENHQRVKDIMEDVDHLSRLVGELLTYSRADMKSATVQLKSIDLLPVVQAAVKRERAPGADIIAHIEPTIQVVASEELLTRAMANIVRNAVKYAGDAGPIEIIAEKRPKMVEIEVRDTGPGVPEDFLDQLFEPFFRPETSRSKDSGGVGLGLAIVKTCVEACQGTVTARNCKPVGFAVTISLPR